MRFNNNRVPIPILLCAISFILFLYTTQIHNVAVAFAGPPMGLVKKVGSGTTVKAGAGFGNGPWRTFDITDGLPATPHIMDIAQDKRGYLWFGTQHKGVIRYNGDTFVNLTTEDGLVGDTVRAIVEDSQGYLWFGTEAGVSRYDGEYFVSFTSEDGLAGNLVWAIEEDREGFIWFGTEAGVSRYDGEQFITFGDEDGLIGNMVLSMLEDRKGNMWFGTDEGVGRFDGREFTNFTSKDGLAGNVVMSIAEDNQNHLWFGTQGKGLSRYDGEEFTNFTIEDGLPGKTIMSLASDQRGHIWFGTQGATDLAQNVGLYDGEKFTIFSTEGLAIWTIFQDRETNMWLGTIGGQVIRYSGGDFQSFAVKDGGFENLIWYLLEDRSGNLWFRTASGYIGHFDGTAFNTLTTADGLASNEVWAIAEDRRGYLWFGTSEGVSRYDGEAFNTLTTADGLASNEVWAIAEDRRGYLWFGTSEGVSRYDGEAIAAFRTSASLADTVKWIQEDLQGNLWFGTNSGVSRYDGERFVPFTTANGLVDNKVNGMLEDRRGDLWFRTDQGISQYNGQEFHTFTVANGLASNQVNSITEDPRGHLWFETDVGMSRFDGREWVNYTAENGYNKLSLLHIDQQGFMWFNVEGKGVSRYDGKEFIYFTSFDSFTDIQANFAIEDRRGHLWFSGNNGISRFDGFVFQTLITRDGLPHNTVMKTFIDGNGSVWISTINGEIARYNPLEAHPPIEITDVVADRSYGPTGEIDLSSSQHFVRFNFRSISFKTRAEQIVYVYQLEGFDKEWRQTRNTQIEYTNIPVGEYVFRVKAVNRDLNYSEDPAEVRVTVHLPYAQIAVWSGLVLSVLGLVFVSAYAVRRNRERNQAREQLVQELEEELQTAHDMQMGLMPTESPKIKGFDVAGRCLPATHVGGDFFQYFPISDNRLAISLADVTGHAMEAAVPVLMFSGILDTQMESGDSLEELFAKLNRSLHRNLNSRTFICFLMGELDTHTRKFRVSNGGCPYPYHYIAATSEVVELQVDAYPLGVRAEATYPVVEAQLEFGDCIVFCSDGIIEAEGTDGEIFGFEQTAATIRNGCANGLTAPQLLDHLISEVKAFTGAVPQGDDQTVVVLAVEA